MADKGLESPPPETVAETIVGDTPLLPPNTSVPADLPADVLVSYNPARSFASAFFASPDSGDDSPVDLPDSGTAWHVEVTPGTVGSVEDRGFHLARVVGRGGFGEVWEGRQRALERTIAIKRLRRHVLEQHSPDSRGRALSDFRQEALTTAALDHPNIVPVYDFASDAEGRPMMAMKLVRGKSWDTIIAEDFNALSTPEYLARHLEILIGMAQAVAFAHSRGIVHRDLKPSQVMVGEFGEVLLMDWGLALYCRDSLPPDTADRHLVPLSGFVPTPTSATNPSGTVAFMAPEQTESTAANIGPWTDVYLLGGSLYYMLTGRLPHEGADARSIFCKAALGIVVDPRKAAPARDIPQELADLAMEAMAFHPKERIASAKDFIVRVRAYLTGATKRRESAAIAAQVAERLARGGCGYRDFGEMSVALGNAKGFWPDNPVLAPLRETVLAGFAEAAIGNGDLTLASVQAEALETDQARAAVVGKIVAAKARLARHRTQRRLAFAGLGVLAVCLVGALLSATLARQNERLVRGTAALLEDINRLRGAEARVASELADQLPPPQDLYPSPYAKWDDARVRSLLAERESLRTKRRELSGDERVGDRLGEEPLELILADAAVGLQIARSPGEVLRAYAGYAAVHARRPTLSEPLVGMGIAAARADQLSSAALHLQSAADLVRAQRGDTSPEYARVLALAGQAIRRRDENLATVLNLDGAETTYREYYAQAIRILERQTAEHALRLGWLNFVASNFDRAERFTSLSLELLAERLPATDERLQEAQFRYAQVLRDTNRQSEAKAIMDRLHRQSLEQYGPDDFRIANILSFQSIVERDLGEYRKQLELALEAYRIAAATLSPGDTRLVDLATDLADAYTKQGMFAEAEKYARLAVDARLVLNGKDHPNTGHAIFSLALATEELGRVAEAEELYREALRIERLAFGDDHHVVATILDQLAFNLTKQRRYLEAEPLYRDALEIRKRLFGPRHEQVAASLNNVAYVLNLLGETERLLPMLEEVVQIFTETFGPDHPDTLAARYNYAQNLSQAGYNERSEPILAVLAKTAEERLGPDHPNTLVFMNGWASALNYLERYTESERIYRAIHEIRLRKFGPNHPARISALGDVADNLGCQRRFDESLPMMKEVATLANEFGQEVRLPPQSYAGLGWQYLQQGDAEKAEPLLRFAYAELLKIRGRQLAAPRSTVDLINLLAPLLEAHPRDGERQMLAARLANAWQAAQGEVPRVFTWSLRNTRNRDWASGEISCARILLAGPASNRAAAIAHAKRAAFVLGFAAAGEDDPHWMRLRDAIAPACGLSATALEAARAAGRGAAGELWRDRTLPVAADAFRERLDAIAPITDWQAAYPEIGDGSLSPELLWNGEQPPIPD